MKGISACLIDFVSKVWLYIENVVVNVLKHHCDNYPPLYSSTIRDASTLISKMKDQSVMRVVEIVEMEKLANYTCMSSRIHACLD